VVVLPASLQVLEQVLCLDQQVPLVQHLAWLAHLDLPCQVQLAEQQLALRLCSLQVLLARPQRLLVQPL
jgi:hypothetical protein